MGILDRLHKLSGSSLVGRWGIGVVTEAYETGFGPYTIIVLYNEKIGKWAAYFSREDPPFRCVVNAPTKEEAAQGLETQLRAEFQKFRKGMQRELDCLDHIEGMFDQEASPKSALERLDDEPM